MATGTLAGNDVLPALQSSTGAMDPEVLRLAEAFSSVTDGGGQGYIEDGCFSAPAPSLEAQSILVDLGRTALQVKI